MSKKVKPKVGRPKAEEPKVRVHITIDKNLRDAADKVGRSQFFNEAGNKLLESKSVKKKKVRGRK